MKITLTREQIESIHARASSHVFTYELTISEDQIVKEDKPKAKIFLIKKMIDGPNSHRAEIYTGDIIKLEEVE